MNTNELRNIDAQIAELVYQNEVFYDNEELVDKDGRTVLSAKQY